MGLVILSLSFIVVFVGTVLPQPAIAWLRGQVPLFAQSWDSLDHLLPLFNPLHILLYAWIAVLWRLLAPRWSRWSILLLGGTFAGVSETLQMFAPGRTARISDVLNDVAGIVLGLVLAAVVERIGRRSRGAS